MVPRGEGPLARVGPSTPVFFSSAIFAVVCGGVWMRRQGFNLWQTECIRENFPDGCGMMCVGICN